MAGATQQRSFAIRTYGCQMNMHDSERLAGLLEDAGYRRAASGATPDLIVFNTCAVRENADNRLYGNLGQLLPVKNTHPGLQIAVGGCLAQKDREVITTRAPWVDVVFGTHNIGSLPALLDRARVQQRAQVEIVESLERFPSVLPARRESAYSAWVAISVGCHTTCTFCIVPSLRGREEDRRPGDVLAEIRALVADGAVEVTLLGQNVNSYGAAFGDRLGFSKLLRACGGIEGLGRVRFTSPHPRDFTDDVIEAMAQTPNVMPQLHMPLQSGSDAVLRAMRRAYRRDKYLGILGNVRAAIPDAAITTDIIVGFPGETESDFADTLDVVRQARFAGAFTFRYSTRPGTPAATMDEQVPADVVQDRYERLVALVEETSLAGNRRFAGREVEVLVAAGEGRKDDVTHRMSGRARDNRLVHFAPWDANPRPGDVVTTVVTHAAPHYLIADGEPLAVRRTSGGDAWAARQARHDGPGHRGGPGLRRPGPARHAGPRPARVSVLAAAAVCPHPPLLVPEAMGAAGPHRDGDLGALLAACDAATLGLPAAEPDVIVVVGGAATTAAYEWSAAGSLREFGVGYAVGTGEPVLPLSLTVGSWLLRRAGLDGGRSRFQAVARDTAVADCLLMGAELAVQAPRVAMLAMGDGPARRAVGIEGAADPEVERYDAEVAAALAGADPVRLAGLVPALDDELVVAGRAAWQVLAAAGGGRRLAAQLRCAVARYEVSYLVASWDVIG